MVKQMRNLQHISYGDRKADRMRQMSREVPYKLGSSDIASCYVPS